MCPPSHLKGIRFFRAEKIKWTDRKGARPVKLEYVADNLTDSQHTRSLLAISKQGITGSESLFI